MVFHVLNRGIARMQLFAKVGDYEAFDHAAAAFRAHCERNHTQGGEKPAPKRRLQELGVEDQLQLARLGRLDLQTQSGGIPRTPSGGFLSVLCRVLIPGKPHTPGT